MRDRGSAPAQRRDRNGVLTPERSSQADVSARVLCGSKILLVEDEIIIAMEVQSALEEAGGKVVGPADTLDKAVALAAAEDLSAAVLDLRLGSQSADKVARLLARRGVPFVFYTGQTRLDPERAKWPDVATISKPASGETLVKAVATLLDQDAPTSH